MSNFITNAISKQINSGIEKIKGALPSIPSPAKVNFTNAAGNKLSSDLRVKIRVPDEYLQNFTWGNSGELSYLGGIVFPYTPVISLTHKADYTLQTPLHSNFALNFYKSSSVTPITISGKFTVQNDDDAGVFIGTLHLLRALVKMKSGDDADSGAPPPVCRLDAYGAFMLENVPVAISEFKVEFPENVDYYSISVSGNSSKYEQTTVPTVCTISVTCIPMYSRSEMQKYSVNSWINDSAVRKGGYL